jgi:hypothetical protein
MQCETELFQIVPATRPSRRFSNFLYRRQEKSEQNRDRCDHDEKFDERHTPVAYLAKSPNQRDI